MKTYAEINEKISQNKAVVLTAEEVKNLAQERGVQDVAKKVDVVTTATFSPMCSSGVFLNLGHATPPLKMQRVRLDGVPAYGGIAAADVFLGATESHPGNSRFGGAHVIEKLVRGEAVEIHATGQPSDCYPRSELRGHFTLEQINQAYFFNPRNCYQNYNAATNSSGRPMHTYMGRLRAHAGSVHFSGTGELSPLCNDPELRTVGLGTPVFCCGGLGMVAWEGTQFNRDTPRDPQTKVPTGPAATLAIVADLRQADARYLRPVVIPGYGISLYVGIGIAIPVLDADLAARVAVRNADLRTNIVDYATGDVVDRVTYADLFERSVHIFDKTVPTKTMTDLRMSRKIAAVLKEWVCRGLFPMRPPVQPLPILGKNRPYGGSTS